MTKTDELRATEAAGGGGPSGDRATERSLIVNADEFGRSYGTKDGIIHAHAHGIVTSASLMVRWPAARAAADYARGRPELSVGLHLDLAECTYGDGEWVLVYDHAPAAREIRLQLVRFRALIGRNPTHLDSHQRVHCEEPIASLLADQAQRLGVPLREPSPIRYCRRFLRPVRRGRSLP